MMKVYKTPSKEIQEIILANVTYEKVIEGLNGYFASEPRNNYITVKMESDKEDFALYEAEAWADILISWLRTEHGIFYYPGMEAGYAKMERIPPLTERLMDKGALNSLKALHKRVTGEEAGTNSHTLIADGIKCFVNGKESEIKKLKAELNALKDTVSKVRSRLNKKFCNDEYEDDLEKLADIAVVAVETRDATINNINVIRPYILAHLKKTLQSRSISFDKKDEKDILKLIDLLALDRDKAWGMKFDLCEENQKLKKDIENVTETNCKDIMGYIRYEASQNGFELPEEIDGAPLTVKRVFHDLLEIMRNQEAEVRRLNAELATKWTKTSLVNWLQQRARHKGVELDGAFLYSDDTQYDWTDIVNFLFDEIVKMRGELGAKESGIDDLKEHITLLEADLKKAETKNKELAILKEQNEILKDLATLIKSERDRYLEQRDKATADYQALYEENQKLKEANASHPSDINQLISDFCTKNDVTPPSPYFSDESSIEYLFSVVDLERKHRAAVGKQMVDDYEKDLLKFIYKEYKDRIGLSDITITYDPPSVRNTVLKIISDYARSRVRVDILETRIKSIFDRCKANFTVDDYVLNGDPTTSFMLDCISSWIGSPAESRGKTRAEIENYKLKLKDYILKDIKEHGYRYDGLEKKSIEEIVDWIITMATCPKNEWAKDEIKKLRGQIDSLKSLINAMNEEVKDM